MEEQRFSDALGVHLDRLGFRVSGLGLRVNILGVHLEPDRATVEHRLVDTDESNLM